MKVLIVFGTRPEAIKLSPVIAEMRKRGRLSPVVCVTAQHREMLDQVLGLFRIEPDYDLDIMSKAQTLYDVTARSILSLKPVLEEVRPGLVLVQGDTTTTFAASLAAYYEKVPVGHVEAGLRTYDKYRPFPEEINRRLTSQIADLHFAPTETARRNLLEEGVDGKKVFVTGNTVIDALLAVSSSQTDEVAEERWLRYFKGLNLLLDPKRRLILVTGHRRENFGPGFDSICLALRDIALKNPGVDIVYPVHLNPNVQGPVKKTLSGLANVHLLPALEYEPFVFLMSRSYLILTDSGGVQEEAPALGKPVLVMRDITERPEGVEAGTVKLVGTEREKIAGETAALLNDVSLYESMSRAHNPYGDGKAAARIADIIEGSFLK